ncbi:MAG TPA: carboxypeptidase regulatory-like domain-containing protein [Terracidiphilus sp.]|nr:carboxypeptidase regulatory-like domain-containing protein [Terracidiphilus sp.]
MISQRIRRGFLYLAILMLASLGAVSLCAQSTTQGAVAGTVEDPSGAVVGGATVTIRNNNTNATVQVTADPSGYFNAPLLEPGTYTVSISAPGFASYRADSVTVVVGQVTSLMPHLALSSSTTEVVVTEQTPVMNLESPDFTDTLNQKAMQNVPINNRRWSALALMTPGVTVDSSGYGLISVRGISTILNNVEIDGADDNQAFFAEERGRTREAYSTSGNAVREFAVNTGVYSAEYGRAAGGVVTSVTKSGTNELHGQAYFYDKESNWNAFNNYTKVTTLVNGQNQSSVIKPKDLRKIYGFTAGGALIKDKLFWIYTYDQHSHVFPVVGVPSSPSQFYTLPQPTLSSGETCNTTTGALAGAPAAAINDANACALAARQKISYSQASYDWAALTYGSSATTLGNYPGATAITDPGFNSAIGLTPRFGYQEINTPKLDWQITPKMRWSTLFHRLRWDSPGGVQTAASDNYSQDAQGNDFVKLDYGVTKLTSFITNNISNEVLYQYGRELDYETQQPFTAFSKAHLISNGVATYATGFTYAFNIGSPYYSWRVAYPDERKWQIGDIVYWNKGRHSLRFGVDAVHNYDLMNNTFQSNGSYSYQYVGNFYNDILNQVNGVSAATSGKGCDASASQNGSAVTGVNPCYRSFSQGFGNPVYAMSTLDAGVFAQDNWKFSPRLTIELGLRWDKETIPGPDPNLTAATGSFVPYNGMTNAPSDNADFGPRVGFSYDLFGHGDTVIRGGYGFYYGRVTNGNIENVRLNTGSPNGQFSRTWSTTQGGPTFPTIIGSAATATCTAGTSSCPSSYFLASNLKLPQVQEFDLQIQQAFPKSTVFSLSYLGGLGRHLPNFLDVNLNPNTMTTKTVTIAGDPNGKGPLGATGATIQVPIYTSFGNTALLGANAANFGTIGEMISNVNSSYNAMVAEVVNHSLKNIDFDANYTWSHSLDFAQNANTQGAFQAWYDPYTNARANYGNSQWNIPNRFVAYALYRFPNLPGANTLKWVANGWSINDSFQMQNGLPFSGGLSGSITGGALTSGWNDAGGPAFIPQIGYDTYRYPRRIVDDARVQKEIQFERGINLQLMLNAFNVANHQNVTGYQATYLYLVSGTTATYTGQDGTGAKTFKVVNNSNSSNFTYSPRQIEISFRLNF